MSIPKEWQIYSKHKADEILKEVTGGEPVKTPILINDVIDSYLVDVCIRTHADFNFPEGVSAFSKKDMSLGWIIVVNGKESVVRQRFSAAHELGHIVLFANQPNEVFCSNESKGWVEKICDRFAGDILMPEDNVRKHYNSNSMTYLEDIAKMFKVSKQVAEIQLKNLGLPFKRMV